MWYNILQGKGNLNWSRPTSVKCRDGQQVLVKDISKYIRVPSCNF